MGVIRAIDRPPYEDLVRGQVQAEEQKRGVGSLEELIWSGDLWTVGEDGAVSRPD